MVADNPPFLAQASIGQNEVQSTPLQMALVAAAVANDGKVMRPHVMREIRDDQDNVVDRYEPTEGSRRPREAMVQLGDFKVALADASASPLNGFPHYTLIAEHRPKDQLLADFELAGVKVESVRDHADGEGYSCTIRDPDGNLLELWLSRQNG